MAVFSGQGIDAEVQTRILNFLNNVTSASQLAGNEPQEGPVHDDPTKGYGDQINDYDIGLTVAQRILDKRATLGSSGFTNLSQLSNIDGFGQDKFDDLTYSFGPAFYGKWEQIGESPVYVVHAAVLNSGKVLMFAGKAESANLPLNSAVWDPKKQAQPDEFDTQEVGQLGTYTDDLFCSHHSFLADGKLLVNGGDLPGHTLKATNVFNPDNNQWLSASDKPPDMIHARWYPTTLTLPEDEGVITFSGDDNNHIADISGVEEVEKYSKSGNTWSEIPDADKALKIYPGMHLISNGKIFYTGTCWRSTRDLWIPTDDEQTALFDRSATANKWSNVGHHIVKDRTEGMSVILPPDNKRVLVIGGRGDSVTNSNLATDSVEMINFNDSNPSWKEVKKMNFKRRNVNAVLLPTGKVLVCAGIQGFKWGNPGPDPVFTAEEYDPSKDKWIKLADMKVARLYHSVSLLLPDARVLNLGSVGAGGTINNDLIKDMEIFSPPYLFSGNSLATRPSITKIPKVMHHKQTYTLETPDAESIDQVVLVRPGSVTHHTDTEQRVIPVTSIISYSELKITMPSGTSPNYDAVRGYYMIFIINKKGVPSKAEFIFLH